MIAKKLTKEEKEFFRKGIKVYKKMIDAGHGWAYNNLGAYYLVLEKYEKAEKVYKEAMNKGENVYTNYAVLLQRQKRYDEAEEMFKRALASDQYSFLTLYYYGNFLYEAKRYDEAEEMYKKSIMSCSANFTAVHLAYASLLCDVKRYEEAKEELRKAYGSMSVEILRFIKNIGKKIKI